MVAGAASREALQGMAKVLEAFFKESPHKSVREVLDRLGKNGADDLADALRRSGFDDAMDALRRSGGDDVADVLAKNLDELGGKGAKSGRQAIDELGQSLEKSARDALDRLSKGARPPAGFDSWTDYASKLLDEAVDPNMVRPHGHHVPFKNWGSGPLKERLRDVQVLMMKCGIDPVYGKEVLMIAPNGIHTDALQKQALDLIQDGFARGGPEGLREGIELAKDLFR